MARIANLPVRVNQHTTADVELTVGPTAQTVEVTAAGETAIDVASTTVGATIDRQLAANVPVQRNISARDLNSPIVLQVTRGNDSDPVVRTDTRYHAAFIQDSWTMLGNRVTFRPGIRYEYHHPQPGFPEAQYVGLRASFYDSTLRTPCASPRVLEATSRGGPLGSPHFPAQVGNTRLAH